MKKKPYTETKRFLRLKAEYLKNDDKYCKAIFKEVKNIPSG